MSEHSITEKMKLLYCLTKSFIMFDQLPFREALLYEVWKEYSHLKAASANYNWSNFVYIT